MAKIKGKNQGKIKDVFSPERSKVVVRRGGGGSGGGGGGACAEKFCWEMEIVQHVALKQ